MHDTSIPFSPLTVKHPTIVYYDEFRIWHGIKQRCLNPNSQAFKKYGAQGIKICDQWRDSFRIFLRDVGPRPSSDHSIDRWPDKNGNYEPGNVRWATPRQQSNNKNDNHLITVNNVTKTVQEWADIIGIKPNTLLYRIRRGWELERALAPKVTPKNIERRNSRKTKCLMCGEPFIPRLTQLRQGQGKVCSQKCNYKNREIDAFGRLKG